ncbi:hypothetical protein HHL19_00230 [Streptomyces sp. R302]|nr:hypothetical protein [Streptomyces sp. R301]NML77128.1 hypothetical protein [Streptomyces sp. R302]
MAWDEWEQIKAGVAEPGPAAMQLNQLTSAGGGGGTANLSSCVSRKKAAANAIGNDLEPGVRTHGKDAEESTASAVKEFGPRDGEGWDTAAALKKAHAAWEKQVKALVGRLTFEKNGLADAGLTLRGVDIDFATRVELKSNISGC